MTEVSRGGPCGPPRRLPKEASLRLLLVLLLPCLLLAAGPAATGAAGIEPVTVTTGDGTIETWLRINTGNGDLFDQPIERQVAAPLRADTGLLWVDRNHRNAIGSGAALSADGRHAFVNWYLNAQRAGYYRVLGSETPVWESPGDFTWASNGDQLDVSADGAVMAISSVNEALKLSRSSPYPGWTEPYPLPATAFAKASRDGELVVACGNGTLYWYNADDGSLRWFASVPEPTRLQGIDLSADGKIVAVTVYDSCLVYEQGARRGQVPIGTSSSGTQYAAAISDDGSRLVTGDYQGRVKFWVYDSGAYVLRWQASVGTPWVAGVGVSADGSTIACGTGYQNGKLCVFDSSSATPIMTYQNYGSSGAYVPAVALSDDGSRVAAASWGDIAPSGDFRVFTVHNRSDTTPLVAVTRDQEPGSLFACDISADGRFAIATGKAVHAQQMGNGGEVYAALIGATDPVNVGVTSIESPGRHLQVGVPATPRAVVRNYGDSTVAIPTRLVVTDTRDSVIYRDSTVSPAIGPDEMAEVSFQSFTPDHYDLYTFDFFTALPGDAYPPDDTISLPVKCYHDAVAQRIGPPGDEVTVGLSLRPGLVIRNSGSYTEYVGYHLAVTDSSGSRVYADSGIHSGLAPEQSFTLQLGQWTPALVGAYTATATVNVADDFYPASDTGRRDFRVTYEIIYDDGGPEGYYWVGRRDNDKFYVRFTPTLTPPYSITHGRVLVNLANQPFDYVMVCPGSGNKPDTLAPLQVIADVSTPVAPGWIDFDLDITRQDANDVWVILHWPSTSPGLGVGADAALPIDLRSYFSSNQDTFRLWSTHDWMVRLTQSPEVGVAGPAIEPLRFALGAAVPNPFRGSTRLELAVPNKSRVRLALYDRAGRLVRTLLDAEVPAGRSQVAFEAVGADGCPLAPGVYFARLRDSGTGATAVTKVTLTR
jgi:WD40 repeat protein